MPRYNVKMCKQNFAKLILYSKILDIQKLTYLKKKMKKVEI